MKGRNISRKGQREKCENARNIMFLEKRAALNTHLL